MKKNGAYFTLEKKKRKPFFIMFCYFLVNFACFEMAMLPKGHTFSCDSAQSTSVSQKHVFNKRASLRLPMIRMHA